MGADYLCILEAAAFYNPRFCFINTMYAQIDISAAIHPGLPKPPARDFLRKIISCCSSKLYGIYENIFQLGYTTPRIIRKAIDQQQAVPDLSVQNNSPVSLTFTGVPELVLSAGEYNFPWETPPAGRHFIGAWIKKDRIDFMVPEQKKALYELLDKATSIIYVSLGTQQKKTDKSVVLFIRKITEAAGVLDKCSFIIANAAESLRNKFQYQHPNVYFFDSLPQLAVLEKAAVFITHGGLNSIKESIHAGVPMLLYPINKKYDQISNVEKAVYHRLGLTASRKDHPSLLAAKLTRLMTEPLFKEAIITMKTSMDKSPATGQIRDMFKYIFPCTSLLSENQIKSPSFTNKENFTAPAAINDN